MNCSWCESGQECKSVDSCFECGWASESRCGSGEFIGCKWCTAKAICVNEVGFEEIANSCVCGNATNKAPCQSNFGCRWCEGTLRCLDVGISCFPCSSRDTEAKCTSPECQWSEVAESCFITGHAPIISCGLLTIDSCKSWRGCHWCPDQELPCVLAKN